MTGSLLVGSFLDRVPNPQALRLVIADQVAAFGLFALDHNITCRQLLAWLTGVVQYLLDRDQAFGLESHVDNDMLIGELDDGTRDNVVVKILAAQLRRLARGRTIPGRRQSLPCQSFPGHRDSIELAGPRVLFR